MTILIKGIDMPPDIEGAEVIIHIKPDGTVFDMRGVHLQARAVEVPAPHGRLIDADDFDSRIRAAGGQADEELTDDFKDGVLTVLALMETQNTVIEAEEVNND